MEILEYIQTRGCIPGIRVLEEMAVQSSSSIRLPRKPLSRRLVVIENRFDLRALINVYARGGRWRGPFGTKGRINRETGGSRCPDEEGCVLVPRHRRKDEWNDQIEFQPDTRAAVLSAFSPPRHTFQIHLLDRDAICVHFTKISRYSTSVDRTWGISNPIAPRSDRISTLRHNFYLRFCKLKHFFSLSLHCFGVNFTKVLL